MSQFVVPVKRIRAIEPHPNADAIEFAVIDGYRSIVKKGQFKSGELIAYLPEASLLPQWLLKALNFWDNEKNIGKLLGKEGNRIRAMRLRGELSQGICYDTQTDADGQVWLMVDSEKHRIAEGENVADLLGVSKYEPPVPVGMSGEVFSAGAHLTISFDVENWKTWPDILQNGEEVIFTEKLHGSFTGIAVLPLTDAHPEAFGENKNILIFSKGLGAKGMVFQNNEKNASNLYVRSTRQLIEVVDALNWTLTEPLFLMGEIFGPGVQDLAYGKEIGLRLFAMAKGYRNDQTYFNFDDLKKQADTLGVETVPVLWRGPFSQEVMQEYTDGKTVMDAAHIREGIVMTPAQERVDSRIGRVSLKSVSADYLCRKGATEYQ